jgi:hypothetical protein
MRHLSIDRILSKEALIKQGKEFGELLKNKINSRCPITDLEVKKIDELTRDVKRHEVFRLASIGTPFEDFTPIKFDMVFSYDDLDVTERVDLVLEHVVYLHDNYLLQLPLGHHCEVYVKINSGRPSLFDLLPTDSYDKIKVGICNKSDWMTVKSNIQQL